jgi:Ca-activated chloride channel homolog
MVSILFSKPILLWFLLAIPLLIIIHMLTLKTTTRKAVQFANFEAISRITGNQILSKNYFLLFTRVSIFVFVVFAVSGTSLGYQGQGSEFDYILAIDTSSSMFVQDFEPNRIEATKEAAKDFIDTVSYGNNIGVVSFSGTTKREHALSEDHLFVKQAVDNIKISNIGGTDIGEAIITSTNLLLKSENPRILILLTDGQSNIGIPISEAVDYANDNLVTIYSIGVATEEGGKLLGTDAILKLDQDTLQNIALATEGKFYLAQDEESLNNAYLEIAQLKETRIMINLTLTFLIIALLLLIMEWSIANTKYRTIP